MPGEWRGDPLELTRVLGIGIPLADAVEPAPVFEPGRWTHVAWVWGPKEYTSMVQRNTGRGVATAIYVNGRAAQQYTYNKGRSRVLAHRLAGGACRIMGSSM